MAEGGGLLNLAVVPCRVVCARNALFGRGLRVAALGFVPTGIVRSRGVWSKFGSKLYRARTNAPARPRLPLQSKEEIFL